MSEQKDIKTGAELINPYDDRKAKGEQVEQMFDSIAPAYDFMNFAMTFGLHRIWRNKALNAAAKRLANPPSAILDVATGTGDLAFILADRYPEAHITGADISEGMLDIARKKLSSLPEQKKSRITFASGDCMNLTYPDASFSLITVAYGVRNFEHLSQGLKEMRRVMAPGGVICIIELSVPEAAWAKAAYNIYAHRLIPFVGKMVSGDSRAYTYLPESIAAAPQRDALTRLMEDAGFTDCRWKSLTFGAVTYYTGVAAE